MSTENGVATGVWECEPGSFEVPARENTESVYILSGVGSLTDMESGEEREIRAGSVAVLEKGSSVKWCVREKLTKFYVIVDA